MIECSSQQLQRQQPQRFYCEDEETDDCQYYPAKKKSRRSVTAVARSGDNNDEGSNSDNSSSSSSDGSTIMSPTLKRPSYILKRKTLRAKFKKPKKSVRFAATAAAVAIEEPALIRAAQQQQQAQTPTAAINDSWYGQSDLLRFKEETIKLTLNALSNKSPSPQLLPRGTEAMSKNRRRHKATAIRYVLIAHKRGKSDEYVAALSAKLGRWNREIAMGDAIADYYEVYHPALLSLVPRPASSNPPTISLISRGRGSGTGKSNNGSNNNSKTPSPDVIGRSTYNRCSR